MYVAAEAKAPATMVWLSLLQPANAAAAAMTMVSGVRVIGCGFRRPGEGRQAPCLHCPEATHSFGAAMVDETGTSAQRIRIGLTGLAFAFLLVLLGSAISRSNWAGNIDCAPSLSA